MAFKKMSNMFSIKWKHTTIKLFNCNYINMFFTYFRKYTKLYICCSGLLSCCFEHCIKQHKTKTSPLLVLLTIRTWIKSWHHLFLSHQAIKYKLNSQQCLPYGYPGHFCTMCSTLELFSTEKQSGKQLHVHTPTHSTLCSDPFG